MVTSRNFTRDLGIQWGFNQQTPQFGNTTNRTFPNAIIVNGQGVPATGGLRRPGRPAQAAGIGTAGRGYAGEPARRAASTPRIGISLGNILGSFNLDVALTALERQGRGRLLSTPKVTTQNNQAAEIKQGVQIPIQTVANNTVTVTFKDAVLTLKVTPADHGSGHGHPDRGGGEQRRRTSRTWSTASRPSTPSPPRRRCSCATAPPRSSAASTRATSRRPSRPDAFPGQAAHPGLPVPQPVHDEHEQRVAALHHSPHHQGLRVMAGTRGCGRPHGVVEESHETCRDDGGGRGRPARCRGASPEVRQEQRHPRITVSC